MPKKTKASVAMHSAGLPCANACCAHLMKTAMAASTTRNAEPFAIN
jgi:hypothetical protein